MSKKKLITVDNYYKFGIIDNNDFKVKINHDLI